MSLPWKIPLHILQLVAFTAHSTFHSSLCSRQWAFRHLSRRLLSLYYSSVAKNVETAEYHDFDRSLFDRMISCSIMNDQRPTHSHWMRFLPSVHDRAHRTTVFFLRRDSRLSQFFFFLARVVLCRIQTKSSLSCKFCTVSLCFEEWLTLVARLDVLSLGNVFIRGVLTKTGCVHVFFFFFFFAKAVLRMLKGKKRRMMPLLLVFFCCNVAVFTSSPSKSASRPEKHLCLVHHVHTKENAIIWKGTRSVEPLKKLSQSWSKELTCMARPWRHLRLPNHRCRQRKWRNHSDFPAENIIVMKETDVGWRLEFVCVIARNEK